MIKPARTSGYWNVYVAAGANKEERIRRLAEVPEKWKNGVKSHVNTVMALKARNAKIENLQTKKM